MDLTHSFPSVAGNGEGDYIPPHGFMHRPSLAWPPPPHDEIKKHQPPQQNTHGDHPADAVELPVGEEFKNVAPSASNAHFDKIINRLPGIGENLSITIDGEKIELKEQIQLYAPNNLLSFPLVSPVLQPSLGGLPPMLIQVGGAELLRDEQIYIAHKAANPSAYPPGDAIMNEYDRTREILNRYPPTDVQLQVWDDLCRP